MECNSDSKSLRKVPMFLATEVWKAYLIVKNTSDPLKITVSRVLWCPLRWEKFPWRGPGQIEWFSLNTLRLNHFRSILRKKLNLYIFTQKYLNSTKFGNFINIKCINLSTVNSIANQINTNKFMKLKLYTRKGHKQSVG